jgi:hypothetical protein
LAKTDKVKKLLDRDILEVLLAQRYASNEDKNQLRPENYRYVAYSTSSLPSTAEQEPGCPEHLYPVV